MALRRLHIQNIDLLIAVVLFALSFCIKLPLVKENALGFFADEVRYSMYLTDEFNTAMIKEDFHIFWQSIFDIHARPAYGVLYTPSLYLTNITKNDLFGPVYNLVLNSLCIVLLFFIVKKIFSYKTAFISTGVFLFSMTSLSYVRHMFPYDGALLFFLFGLCVYVYSNSVFFFGVLMGISFAVYPGNYFYILPIPFLMLFWPLESQWKTRLWRSTKFLIGFLFVVSVFEYVSISLGNPMSYIQTAMQLSHTVTQGDFVPAVKFIVQYIYANDGFVGIMVFVTGILALRHMYLLRRKNRYYTIIFFYIVCMYFIMELMSFGTHSMVLYGRTVRILYMFMMLSSAVWLSVKIKHVVFIEILALCIIISWIPRYNSYVAVVYPKDVLYYASLLTSSLAPLHVVSAYKREAGEAGTVDLGSANQFYITNVEFLYPYYGTKAITCGNKIVLLHTLYPLATYKPYLFEGFSEIERGNFYRDPPYYQLIHCQDESS
ncbi:MAG: hypothetical protein WAV51_01135 [Microgenomates group bacterium]